MLRAIATLACGWILSAQAVGAQPPVWHADGDPAQALAQARADGKPVVFHVFDTH